MTWNKTISLEAAQQIFGVKGWEFSFNEDEGCYVAVNGDVKYRNTVLRQLCIKLVRNHMD